MACRVVFLSFLLFLSFTSRVNAQTDTIQPAPIHSPRKATIFSAVLPGLGQAYNKKYWKIPIIYGAFGTLGYFIYDNNSNYKLYKNAYSSRTDDDPLTVDEFEGLYTTENLKVLREYYRRNLELTVIFTFAAYSLNIIDAAVDAHLFDFDVSQDLSLHIQPSITPPLLGHKPGAGITFTLTF